MLGFSSRSGVGGHTMVVWCASFLSCAVLVLSGFPAHADVVTVYTDKEAWSAALGGVFLTESFSDADLNEGVWFDSSESGHINPEKQCYQDVLASHSQNEPHTIWSFVPQITAYGGYWDLGGPGGSGNNLLVYIEDVSFYVGAIPNSFNGGFWGFVSDTPFTSVKLIGGSGDHQQNYCLDDMVYAPVPEPGTLSLLSAGAIGILMALRRRRTMLC